MADTVDTASTPDFIGPYESWVYGEGKVFAAPAIFGDDYSHLTGVFEAATEVNPALAVKTGFTDGNGNPLAWVPVIWRAATMKYRFAPFVFVRPADSFRAITLKALSASLASVSTAILSLQAGNGALPSKKAKGGKVEAEATAKLEFRVNLPVTRDVFDTVFLTAPKVPNVPPDKVTLPANPVIVATIDGGIAFAHNALLDSAGKKTRLDYCWLQGASAPAGGGSVLFGRELTGADIDDLRGRYVHPAGGVDEDRLYAEAFEQKPDFYQDKMVNQFSTHGAHVLAAAGGRGPDMPSADLNATRLIGVQLPGPSTLDLSGFGKDAHILAAFHYIFDRADRLAEKYNNGHPLPLVINFSYGYTGGPHGGLERVEAAIDELLTKRRQAGGATALVMPAGNSFISMMHGVITEDLLKNRRFTVPWRLQPNSRAISYLELWFPEKAQAEKYAFAIRDPQGQERRAIGPFKSIKDGQQVEDVKDAAGAVIGQISIDHFRKKQWRVLLALAPSEPFAPANAGVEAGVWSITVERPGGVPIPVPGIECRIQRSTDPSGYERGARQSYFDDGNYFPFAPNGKPKQDDDPQPPPSLPSFIRRFGTLNGIATGGKMLVVGSHFAQDGTPTTYSAAGYPVGALKSVDCSAASERSNALRGIPGAGTRSGATFAMNGTSAAAPQVTRALAMQMRTMPAKPPGADDRYLWLLTRGALAPGPQLPKAPAETPRLGQIKVGYPVADFSIER